MQQENFEISRASRRRRRWLAVPVALIAAASLTSAGSASQDNSTGARPLGMRQITPPGVFIAETRPSKELELAFSILGKVAEVTVKAGDRVQEGQVLMRQETAIEEARLRAAEAEADVAARIKLAETQAAQARVDLKRIEDTPTGYAVSELEKAQLEVQASETQIVEENRKGLAAAAQADEQRAILAYKTLSSPAAGIVQEIEAAVGEVFGPERPALRVVSIDPLWVEVEVAPATEVAKLKVGDTVQVRYGDDEAWQDATVIFINPVGTPSARVPALPFRLEFANPDGRPAGLRVQVRLPGAAGGAGQQAGNGS